jgi:hypothetical protein
MQIKVAVIVAKSLGEWAMLDTLLDRYAPVAAEISGYQLAAAMAASRRMVG